MEIEEEGKDMGAGGVDSSDREWWPDFEDKVESAEGELDVDGDDEIEENGKAGLEDWCMREESFTPVHMGMEQLA